MVNCAQVNIIGRYQMLIVSITNSRVLNDWDLTTDRLKNLILVLGELIDIRHGYKTCDELTYDADINPIGFVHT